MKNKRFSRKLILSIVLIAMALAAVWGWNNKWNIHDRWVSKNYKSTNDSSEVLANLNLTPQGDLVYRASLTEVDSKTNFKMRCPVEDYEKASVLGCYSARRIYVLKVDEPRLAGVEEVTAAHELLHAKFERMGGDEKVEVEALLSELRKNVSDKEIVDLVANYKENLGEGEALDNELFAIYGTQVKDVGVGLEAIYADYFKNRLDIVERYESYSLEFQKAAAAIVSYDARLGELRSEKESLELEAQALDNELSQEKEELDQLQNGDSAEEYQRAAQAYNIKVVSYNSKVNRIREIIAEYNELVEKRNSEALSAKSLADKLNANVEER